jgi:uncharacterized protein (DUF58 family)
MNMTRASWQERYLKPTILVGLTVIAYIAALNRMQSLIWAIAAALSATLLVGVVWPYWLVRRLAIKRTGPERAEEGETIVFEIEAQNLGFLPRFMVELVDKLPFLSGQANASGEHVLGVVPYVPSRGIRHFSMPLHCEKRGFYKLGPIGLKSSFPLGLAEARLQREEGRQTLTIYPDVFSIISLPLNGAPSQIHRGGYLLPKGSGSAEFSGLREYRRGDNPRHIHWPSTARQNELMVKEFEPLASACLYVALDLGRDANVGRGREASAEYAIRIAASIAQLCCRNSIRIRMAGAGKRPLDIPAASGEHHYQRILDELAVVDPIGTMPYAAFLQQLSVGCSHGETVVVFLSPLLQDAEKTLQALALLHSKGVHLFVIVFDRGSFAGVPEGTRAWTEKLAGEVSALGAYCLQVRCGDDLEELFNS